jgi:antitoxin HicB
LYEAMRGQGVGRAELARRLRWHLPQVARVLDLRHASRMEQVEAALAALGLRLIVDLVRAA